MVSPEHIQIFTLSTALKFAVAVQALGIASTLATARRGTAPRFRRSMIFFLSSIGAAFAIYAVGAQLFAPGEPNPASDIALPLAIAVATFACWVSAFVVLMPRGGNVWRGSVAFGLVYAAAAAGVSLAEHSIATALWFSAPAGLAFIVVLTLRAVVSPDRDTRSGHLLVVSGACTVAAGAVTVAILVKGYDCALDVAREEDNGAACPLGEQLDSSGVFALFVVGALLFVGAGSHRVAFARRRGSQQRIEVPPAGDS